MAIGFSDKGGMKAAAARMAEALGTKELNVRVGFLEGSHCGRNNDASAPAIAFILEHGAPAANIPPRPFFRNMITRRKSGWGKILLTLLRNNHYDVRKALGGLGMVVGEQLQVEIIQTNDPPNKPDTIKAKGFNNPLIDSRNLLRSVDYEVEGETRETVNGSA